MYPGSSYLPSFTVFNRPEPSINNCSTKGLVRPDALGRKPFRVQTMSTQRSSAHRSAACGTLVGLVERWGLEQGFNGPSERELRASRSSDLDPDLSVAEALMHGPTMNKVETRAFCSTHPGQGQQAGIRDVRILPVHSSSFLSSSLRKPTHFPFVPVTWSLLVQRLTLTPAKWMRRRSLKRMAGYAGRRVLRAIYTHNTKYISQHCT